MCKDNKFSDITQNYSRSDQYEIQPECNSMQVTNIGGDQVLVNGKLLLPGTAGQLSTTSGLLGDSYSIGGNENEVYHRRTLIVKFLGAGANPLIEVTFKYFVKS